VTAYRSTASQGMVDLGFIQGENMSFGTAVSADGSVVVGGSLDQAFRWTSTGGMVGLGILPGQLPGNHSVASAVSADGSMVVGSSGFSDTGTVAFRWTPAGGMVSLGLLPGEVRGVGLTGSFAAGVSADGSVVVGIDTAASDRAFVWDATHGMRRSNRYWQVTGST
jgi:probable HAF family extracellular repeat protein